MAEIRLPVTEDDEKQFLEAVRRGDLNEVEKMINKYNGSSFNSTSTLEVIKILVAEHGFHGTADIIQLDGTKDYLTGQVMKSQLISMFKEYFLTPFYEIIFKSILYEIMFEYFGLE